MSASPRAPVVLCLSGHDPTGGAGVQADLETVAALGGRPVSVLTTLTEQDTRNVRRLEPNAPARFSRQLSTLLADVPVAAVKIGLIGEASLIPAIARTLRRLAVPVVLDPVLRAGGGRNLASADLVAAIRKSLLPLTTVVTPNRSELRRLAGTTSDDAAAASLLSLGVGHVLATDGDGTGDTVVNVLYRPGQVRRHGWNRLPGPFHGAGCTLASAIATLLARGASVEQAVADAQSFTHEALRRAFALGKGRLIPDRSRQA